MSSPYKNKVWETISYMITYPLLTVPPVKRAALDTPLNRGKLLPMSETLKFPTGEFTHTELAKHNGKTNQQVWTRYQAAIKSGQIVSAGERPSAGRGKPSKLWKLDPNWVAPVAPVAPATPATPPTPAPTVTVPVSTTDIVSVPADSVPAVTLPQTPAEVTPAVETPAPVVETPVVETPAATVAEATPPVVVVDVVPSLPAVEAVAEAAVTNIATPTVSAQTADATVLKEVCPVCKHPLLSINDATGVMVWCGQGIEVCSSTENPFGHGRNVKDAYETLKAKWDRAMGVTA